MGLLKRTDIVDFLDVTPSAQTNDWAIVGDGMTTGTWTYDAQTTSETYIINDSATTTVDSYSVSMDGEMKCKKGDEVFDFIDGLRKTRAIGESAKTSVLSVYKYDFTTEGGTTTYSAEKNDCTVTITSFGGDGGATPTIGFTIAKNGDPVIGTVTMSGGTPTFTPTV